MYVISLFVFLLCGYTNCVADTTYCSRGQPLPEQAVVTSRPPAVHTETSQLNEDNEDFAGRGRYHQSEIVQGKHFDDDFQTD